MITRINNSDKPKKRFAVTVRMKDGSLKTFHIGQRFAYTYLDGASDVVKKNYQKRHLANPLEKDLIKSLTISPATLSYYLIWGDTRDLYTNAKLFNKML